MPLLEQPGTPKQEDKEEEYDWRHVEDNERLLGYSNGAPPSSSTSLSSQRLGGILSSLPPTSSFPSLFLTTCRRIGFFLIPSFVQVRLRPETVKPHKLHPSAYLDGLRGIAALFVFFCHLTYSCHDVHHGWGLVPQKPNRPNAPTPDPNRYSSFWRLPIVRLLYAGEPMVFIFFVVSGYALSVKPLKLMRTKNFAGLHDSLASSAFRRGMRLFLPCLASTLFTALIVQMGFYELTRGVEVNHTLLTHWHELHPSQLGSIWAQVAHWASTVWDWWSPFTWTDVYTHPDYDEHLWTIPVEFWASLNLFITQLAVSKCRPRLRSAFLAAIMILAVVKNVWPVILFHGGMLIAELEMARAATESTTSSNTNDTSLAPSSASKSTYKHHLTPLWIFLFVLGLYLLSFPGLDFERTPYWITLTSLIPSTFTPERRFWPCIGALLVAYSLSRSPLLKRLFENRLAQYLGRLSFSLYLMQAWVIHTIGYGAFGFFWSIFGTEGASREVGFVCGSAVAIPALIWAADVFWRTADAPSNRFARWLEGKCFVN